ncbi:MAG TPA: sensor domain-containing protein, partial [Pilimelia sp.]|nr:sensor domain-containing protein [Pilimelia sp.]
PLVTAAQWRATGYLASYLVAGPVLAAGALTMVAASVVLGFFTLGLPLLVGTALVLRGCAEAERHRIRLVAPRVVGGYEAVTERCAWARATHRWTDPALGRDLLYLVLLFPVLLALDAVAVALWATVLAGVALPAWYWAVTQRWDNGVSAQGIQIGYLPSGPHSDGFGVWIGDLPSALLAALAFLVLAVPVGWLVRAVSTAHARAARALLRAPTDPLAAAKLVLARPGPLAACRTRST